MKVCPVCGDTYRDHVDFCFSDGAILSLAEVEAAGRESEASELDAPLPRLVQGGQAAAVMSSSASTAETMPLPRPVRAGAATVPAINAPGDDDNDSDSDGDDASGDRTEVDGQVPPADGPEVDGDGDDPEVTAIRMDEPELEGETTEALPLSGDARTVPPAAPRMPFRSGADTLPLEPDEDAEPGDRMRVAPLAEAQTTPFVRPGVAARDVADESPASSARPRASSTATTQLHVQVPKRRSPPAEEPDRSRILAFGAVFAGIVIAVAFVASMAMLVLIVGVGQGIDDDGETVAIAPRSTEPQPAPAPASAAAGPEPEPMLPSEPEPEPKELTPGEVVAVADAPDPTPRPPVPVAPALVPPPSPLPETTRPSRVTFELLPREATVRRDGVPLSLSGSTWELDSTATTFEFQVSAPNHCTRTVRWDVSPKPVRVQLQPCARVTLLGADSVTFLDTGKTLQAFTTSACPPTPDMPCIEAGRHRCVVQVNGVESAPFDCELPEGRDVQIRPNEGTWAVY